MSSKEKAKIRMRVPDVAGGMREVEDHRFDSGEWPIEFDVAGENADGWLGYLRAEYLRRGWTSCAVTEVIDNRNTGTITIDSGVGGDCARLIVTWDRQCHGPLIVRAKPDRMSREETNGFFKAVVARLQTGAKRKFYRSEYLHYYGLPWHGELWLSDACRLGPPCQYPPGDIGPQIVFVDAEVEAIDWNDAAAEFDLLLRELAAFLSVVLRRSVRVEERGEQAWTCSVDECDEQGRVLSKVRSIAYCDQSGRSCMPTKGDCKPVLMTAVQRPDLTSPGIPRESEQPVPRDLVDLWNAYRNLPTEKCEQFFRVARMWQLALSTWREHETASLVLLVVACEALKPLQKKYNNRNARDVVGALLGEPCRAQLESLNPNPLGVRDSHLHRAELFGSEYVKRLMMSTFNDPSFQQTHDLLTRITPAAIVEWLRRGGTITFT